VAPHLLISATSAAVVSIALLLLYSERNNTWYSLHKRLGGPQMRSACVRGSLVLLPIFEPRIVQPVA